MELLHVLLTRRPDYGGPVPVAEAMATGLAARGHTVHLFPRDEKQESSRYLDYLPGLDALRYLERGASECDVVHVHSLWALSTSLAMSRARRHHTPYVVSPHGMLARWSLRRSRRKKRLYAALIENRNLHSAAALHFFRDQELDDARAAGLRAPCFVLPNGIDAALLEASPPADCFVQRYPETRDRVRLLFLGRLHPVKGLDLLIPAFAEARRSFSDLHLILVGPDEGGYRATVERQIREFGLDGAVTLTGMLTGERKREALGAADFFVLPSYQEADSMAVKEAMAAGLPVVISDAHRFDEVATAGAGIVVPCNSEPLAEALLVLARDARLRANMGQEARRLIQSRYTWDRITEDLERVYTELVEGTRTCGMWR